MNIYKKINKLIEKRLMEDEDFDTPENRFDIFAHMIGVWCGWRTDTIEKLFKLVMNKAIDK